MSPCVRLDRTIPSQHPKYIPKACEGAVRESGTVLCDPPLPPGNQTILRPFPPTENKDKIKGRAPKRYRFAPKTPDPQCGPGYR